MLQTDLKYYYLQQLGIDCWVRRNSGCNALSSALHGSALPVQSEDKNEKNSLKKNPTAPLMIIGVTPNFFEKYPVAQESKLFQRMLASVGLTEQDVCIINLLDSMAPNTGELSVAEIDVCRNFLNEQIQLISPSLILALGQFVAQIFFNESVPLDTRRSVLHQYESHSKNLSISTADSTKKPLSTPSIPLIITFHPADLLRNPLHKKLAYDDLLFVNEVLRLSRSSRGCYSREDGDPGGNSAPCHYLGGLPISQE